MRAGKFECVESLERPPQILSTIHPGPHRGIILQGPGQKKSTLTD